MFAKLRVKLFLKNCKIVFSPIYSYWYIYLAFSLLQRGYFQQGMQPRLLFMQSMKLLVVFLCSAYLMFQGSQCLERFLRTDTKIVQKIKLSEEESTFLCFTICPIFQNAYKVV